jgi:hypothetical protein
MSNAILSKNAINYFLMKLKEGILISLTYLSCLSMKIDQTVQSLYIIPGKGVGELTLHVNTKKDVEAYWGKGKKVDYPFSFSNHSIQLTKFVYPQKGIEVEYSDSHHPKDTATLKTIQLKSPCDLSTKEGIKIGTTRQEVENALGPPLTSKYEKLLNGVYHAIRYNRIEFIFESNSDELEKGDCKVSEIFLF